MYIISSHTREAAFRWRHVERSSSTVYCDTHTRRARTQCHDSWYVLMLVMRCSVKQKHSVVFFLKHPKHEIFLHLIGSLWLTSTEPTIMAYSSSLQNLRVSPNNYSGSCHVLTTTSNFVVAVVHQPLCSSPLSLKMRKACVGPVVI